MRRPRVRPKIEFVVDLPPSEVLSRFRACMAEHDRECKGSILGECIEVTVIADKQHFWSPQLSLQLSEHERGTVIYGRVGPTPQVWTMLIALYAIVAISSIFAMFFAFSQWLLDQPLWALWALPLGLGLTAMVYGTAYVGQRMGADQTHALAKVVTSALDLPEDAMHV